MNSNPNTPQRPQQHSEYNPYFMPYMPSPLVPAPRVSRSQTERQSVNNYLQRYKPYQRPPRRSLGAELSSQIPMFESGKSYQTNKLIDAAPDDDDEDIEDAEKSKTTQDTERKSGDGESASTTQDTTQEYCSDKENEYHHKMTFKLEPNVFSPKHNQVPG